MTTIDNLKSLLGGHIYTTIRFENLYKPIREKKNIIADFRGAHKTSVCQELMPGLGQFTTSFTLFKYRFRSTYLFYCYFPNNIKHSFISNFSERNLTADIDISNIMITTFYDFDLHFPCFVLFCFYLYACKSFQNTYSETCFRKDF